MYITLRDNVLKNLHHPSFCSVLPLAEFDSLHSRTFQPSSSNEPTMGGNLALQIKVHKVINPLSIEKQKTTTVQGTGGYKENTYE